MLALARRRPVWLTALVVWAGVLFFLSSRPTMGPTIRLDHFDKVLHFTYFFGGGFLCAGWLFLKNPDSTRWKGVLTAAIIAMAAIGFLDEWHQLHTPGRSGGDVWDWMADLLGGSAGAFSLKKLHRPLRL
jgi:peptidoglycan/LPS O-acetylase OafA/YrhL